MIEGKTMEAAKLLQEAWAEGKILADLPSSCAPKNEAEATAIGDAIILNFGHEIGGWKIGATGEGPQKALGLTQPFVGAIRASNVLSSPANFQFADLNRPIVESEYAYRLKTDLPIRNEGYSRSDIEAAIGSIICGIEVPLSRLSADNTLGPLALLADHGGTGYYLIGAEIENWRSVDAINTDVTLTFDGNEAGRGTGALMMGDPINALVWFVNYMGEKGIGLKAGQFVSTGSCTGVIPAPGPTTAIADFGSEGQVKLVFN